MRVRKCSVCKLEFKPRQAMQKVCSLQCGIEASKWARKKAYRKETRRRREALKTPSEAAQAAQKAFNRYIRARGRADPCISCGKPLVKGKGTHAGHYRTTKAAPQLRFNTFNCHPQCYSCNTMQSGAIGEYRIALVQKYGLERVEWLENYNESRRYTMEDYERIRKIFTRRAKLYENREI